MMAMRSSVTGLIAGEAIAVGLSRPVSAFEMVGVILSLAHIKQSRKSELFAVLVG